jgi:hypothetical protein
MSGVNGEIGPLTPAQWKWNEPTNWGRGRGRGTRCGVSAAAPTAFLASGHHMGGQGLWKTRPSKPRLVRRTVAGTLQ